MTCTQQEKLLKFLKNNTTFSIDPQRIGGQLQVAVWLKSFGKDWSICYQNGDMNGDRKGEAVFDNAGADCGLIECRDILKNIPEFQSLVDLDTYCSYEDLDELIRVFCSNFAQEHNIDSYFEDEDEEETDQD